MVPWQSDPFAGFPPIPKDFEEWGKRASCKTGPTQVFQKGKYTIQRYTDCVSGAQMDLVKNHGGSHEWPSDSDFDTTSYIHEFFNNVSGINYGPSSWLPANKSDLPISNWPNRTLQSESILV